MGTRSAIAYYTDRGTVRGKYSHYDGYPEYTGAVLEEHYTDVARVRNMVDLGDQSYILPEFIPTGKHTFEEPEEYVTIFYGRDRGESGVEAREFDTIQEFVDYYADMMCEYFYIFTDKGWLVSSKYYYEEFAPVADKISKEVS